MAYGMLVNISSTIYYVQVCLIVLHALCVCIIVTKCRCREMLWAYGDDIHQASSWIIVL